MAPRTGKFLLGLATLSVLTLNQTTAKSTKEVAKEQPHIILIVADDLGFNDVSWKNPYVRTPNLQKLAETGVILDQSYVQPRCTPTRAALLTGRYPFTMGLQNKIIRPGQPRGVPIEHKMLPHLLKKVGYSTHAVGKWHLGFCHWDYTPTKRGFDSFYGFYAGSANYFNHSKRPTFEQIRGDTVENATYCQKYSSVKAPRSCYLDLRNNTKVDASKNGIYSPHLFGKVSENIMRSSDPTDPMFLYLAFQTPHAPLQVPKKYLRFYEHIKNHNRRIYLGMVTAMDEVIGKLVETMKETGHYNNSVIIFTSDNGGSPGRLGASNWPLRGTKGSLWEGGTRASAIIHSPHLRKTGITSNHLIHATDWFSTILAIAGGKGPPKIDSLNQWDVIAGIKDSQRYKMIYNLDYTRNKFEAAVRIGNYKMLVGAMEKRAWVSPSTSDDSRLIGKRDGRFKINEEHTSASKESVSFTTVVSGGEEEEKEEYEEEEEEEENHDEVRSFSFLRRKPEKDDPITWKDLKDNRCFTAGKKVIKRLDKHIADKVRIRLFNVKDDPEERNNLSTTRIAKLKPMMIYLSKQFKRYVPVRRQVEVQRSHPSLFNNTWSPGWCSADY